MGLSCALSAPTERRSVLAVATLLCSKAGDWITGQTILVDGGWITRL